MGLDPVEAQQVQKLMDAGSQTLGSRHRHLDPNHSLQGAALAMLRDGTFSSARMQAAAAHLAQDKMFDALGEAFPKGPARRVMKGLAEDVLVRTLRSSRRNR